MKFSQGSPLRNLEILNFWIFIWIKFCKLVCHINHNFSSFSWWIELQQIKSFELIFLKTIKLLQNTLWHHHIILSYHDGIVFASIADYAVQIIRHLTYIIMTKWAYWVHGCLWDTPWLWHNGTCFVVSIILKRAWLQLCNWTCFDFHW